MNNSFHIQLVLWMENKELVCFNIITLYFVQFLTFPPRLPSKSLRLFRAAKKRNHYQLLDEQYPSSTEIGTKLLFLHGRTTRSSIRWILSCRHLWKDIQRELMNGSLLARCAIHLENKLFLNCETNGSFISPFVILYNWNLISALFVEKRITLILSKPAIQGQKNG